MNVGPAKDVESVLAAERGFRAALVAADAGRLDAMLADEFLYAHGSGRFDDKAGYVRIITEGRFRILDETLAELHVKAYGDAALITGDVAVTKEEKTGVKVTTYLFVTVWRRQDSTWRLVHYHHTRKGPPKQIG